MFAMKNRAWSTRIAGGAVAFVSIVVTAVVAHPGPGAATVTPHVKKHCVGLGVSTNYQWRGKAADAASDLPKLHSLGLRTIREDIFWSNVQPNSAAEWKWDLYDALYERTSRTNIATLPILGYGTTWASEPKTSHDLPSEPAGQRAYAHFAQVFIQRYGVGGIFWKTHPALSSVNAVKAVELWNEPWYATNPSVRDYAALVRLAGDAVHKARPGVLVVANADDRWLGTPVNGAHYWGQALLTLNSRLGDAVDRWAIHPYPWPVEGPNAVGDSVRQVNWLQGLLTERHIRSLIWVTEIGFVSNGAPSASDFKGFLRGVNEMRGPNTVSAVYTFTASRPNSSTKPGSWDYGYNLINKNGQLTAAIRTAAASKCA